MAKKKQPKKKTAVRKKTKAAIRSGEGKKSGKKKSGKSEEPIIPSGGEPIPAKKQDPAGAIQRIATNTLEHNNQFAKYTLCCRDGKYWLEIERYKYVNSNTMVPKLQAVTEKVKEVVLSREKNEGDKEYQVRYTNFKRIMYEAMAKGEKPVYPDKWKFAEEEITVTRQAMINVPDTKKNIESDGEIHRIDTIIRPLPFQINEIVKNFLNS